MSLRAAYGPLVACFIETPILSMWVENEWEQSGERESKNHGMKAEIHWSGHGAKSVFPMFCSILNH